MKIFDGDTPHRRSKPDIGPDPELLDTIAVHPGANPVVLGIGGTANDGGPPRTCK